MGIEEYTRVILHVENKDMARAAEMSIQRDRLGAHVIQPEFGQGNTYKANEWWMIEW